MISANDICVCERMQWRRGIYFQAKRARGMTLLHEAAVYSDWWDRRAGERKRWAKASQGFAFGHAIGHAAATLRARLVPRVVRRGPRPAPACDSRRNKWQECRPRRQKGERKPERRASLPV